VLFTGNRAALAVLSGGGWLISGVLVDDECLMPPQVVLEPVEGPFNRGNFGSKAVCLGPRDFLS
jgi:hypothetical protein